MFGIGHSESSSKGPNRIRAVGRGLNGIDEQVLVFVDFLYLCFSGCDKSDGAFNLFRVRDDGFTTVTQLGPRELLCQKPNVSNSRTCNMVGNKGCYLLYQALYYG